jgi:hypothetical protein
MPQKKTQEVLSKSIRSTMKQKKTCENHDKLQNNNHHNVNELKQLS